MKKILLMLLLVLLLAGCQGIFPNEYLYVNEHDAPFAYRETDTTDTGSSVYKPTEELTAVSRGSDIREAIKNLVLSGQETGEFLLVDYVGDIERDMKTMYTDLLGDSPKYTYAMDSLEWSLSETEYGNTVNVSLKLRLAPQEVQAIPTLRFPEPAMTEIKEALLEHVSTYTVQVSGYQDTDLDALLEAFILEHPDQIVDAPGVSVSVYPPDRGSVRILEFHFIHNTDRETMLQHRDDVDSFLNLISNQLNRKQSAKEIVNTIYESLTPAVYSYNPNASVYSMAYQKSGNSRVVASITAFLCNRLGAQCEIVIGKRGGETWYWNRIMSDGKWLSFDLHSAALEKKPPALLPSEAMAGYSWDRERYPEVNEPDPIEPQTPYEPEASSEPVDFSESVDTTETEQTSEPTGTLAEAP